MNQKLLCIGHTTLDTFITVEDAKVHCDINNEKCEVCFEFGAKIPVDDVRYGIGGGAANVSAGTAVLGINVSLFSIIGDDPKGHAVKKELRRHGVDLSNLIFDKNPTDQASIISYGEERTIFTFNKPRIYDLASVKDDYGFVFLSSVGQNVSKLYEQVINLKKNNPKVNLFYNPGSRELQSANEDIFRLTPYIDYLIANVEEGCTVLNKGLKREQVEVDDLLEMLLDKDIRNVVLTDGSNGAYIANREEVFRQEAISSKVVEKTGAGDAFASGFIGAIMYGMDVRVAARWGGINSASVIQQVGAQNGLLSKKEIMARFES